MNMCDGCAQREARKGLSVFKTVKYEVSNAYTDGSLYQMSGRTFQFCNENCRDDWLNHDKAINS